MAAGDVDARITTVKAMESIAFNGTNSYINCGNDESINLSKFTASMWINTHALQYATLISRGDNASTGPGWYFRMSNIGAISLSMTKAVGDEHHTTNDVVFTLEKWHHVITTYDGTNIAIYVDGVSKPLADDTFTGDIKGAWDVQIGRNAGGDWYFNGSMNQVRLWNRAFTAAEADLLYKGNVDRTGLVGEWLLSSDFKDTSGSGNDGTSYNFASGFETIDAPIANAIKAQRVLSTATGQLMITNGADGQIYSVGITD